MNVISLRNADLKDLETLLEFEQGVIEAERPLDPFLAQGELFYYNIPELISSQQIHFIVAISNKKLVASGYLRLENSELLNESTISPRASIAYKSGKHTQFSVAYGQFYQNPSSEFLKFSDDFTAENTSHLIANFQYVKDKKIFRMEAYYKGYSDLVKFDTDFVEFDSNFNNNGSGYAKGLDIFWRDNQSIKNTDYWISYSYLDTEREYRNFPVTARPGFASAHNLNSLRKLVRQLTSIQSGQSSSLLLVS